MNLENLELNGYQLNRCTYLRILYPSLNSTKERKVRSTLTLSDMAVIISLIIRLR